MTSAAGHWAGWLVGVPSARPWCLSTPDAWIACDVSRRAFSAFSRRLSSNRKRGPLTLDDAEQGVIGVADWNGDARESFLDSSRIVA